MTINTEKLIEMGGREWVCGDKCRIYFNLDVTCPIVGFDYLLRKNGRVTWASLNGETVSNRQGEDILGKLSGKIWFDFADGAFHSRDINSDFSKTIIEHLTSAASVA